MRSGKRQRTDPSVEPRSRGTASSSPKSGKPPLATAGAQRTVGALDAGAFDGLGGIRPEVEELNQSRVAGDEPLAPSTSSPPANAAGAICWSTPRMRTERP